MRREFGRRQVEQGDSAATDGRCPRRWHSTHAQALLSSAASFPAPSAAARTSPTVSLRKRTESPGRTCPIFHSSVVVMVAGQTKPPREGPSTMSTMGMSPVKLMVPAQGRGASPPMRRCACQKAAWRVRWARMPLDAARLVAGIGAHRWHRRGRARWRGGSRPRRRRAVQIWGGVPPCGCPAGCCVWGEARPSPCSGGTRSRADSGRQAPPNRQKRVKPMPPPAPQPHELWWILYAVEYRVWMSSAVK